MTDTKNDLIYGWISIKEGIPPPITRKCVIYIVASKSIAKNEYIVESLMWNGKDFIDGDDEIVSIDDGRYVMTHWMPLPPPPKEIEYV